MLAVGLFMDLLEAPSLLEADPARLSARDEAQGANKEYALLEDRFPPDPLQFPRQPGRGRIAEENRQRGRADDRSIVKLHGVRRIGGADLAVSLQIDDAIDERGIGPGLGDAVGLLQRDHVACRLLDDAEAVPFELAQDRRLSSTGRAGQDETPHPGSAAMASRNGPIIRAAKGSTLAASVSL